MGQHISDAQWQQYEQQGYLTLGKVVSDAELAGLQQRIDDIMLGKAPIDYSKTMMQLDSADGAYENTGPQTTGHKGATLDYRKIEQLEFDPLFLAYMQKPLFKDICDHVYGPQTPIACFRAMFMNKPARRGTLLPWHQDRWSSLDRDPLITLWLALDPVTIANGCVQGIPGSHLKGVINPEHPSGFLTPELAAEHCPEDQIVYLELQPGECMLLHNWMLHRSDVNKTDTPRRGFSVCYMHADTTDKRSGKQYTRIFGQGALTPQQLEAAPLST